MVFLWGRIQQKRTDEERKMRYWPKSPLCLVAVRGGGRFVPIACILYIRITISQPKYVDVSAELEEE